MGTSNMEVEEMQRPCERVAHRSSGQTTLPRRRRLLTADTGTATQGTNHVFFVANHACCACLLGYGGQTPFKPLTSHPFDHTLETIPPL